jgi:hypothetical protein
VSRTAQVLVGGGRQELVIKVKELSWMVEVVSVVGKERRQSRLHGKDFHKAILERKASE